ncbi:MAG: methyltransferase domain-containing protein [Bacteroidales bacterium]|nr:methyltransferase domain-containing protein [Bacteroidales bacterium]
MSDDLYIQTLEANSSFTEPAIRQAMASLSLDEEDRVLDVPCGTGRHALWMLDQYPGTKVTCLDLSDAHINYAGKLVKEAEKEGAVSLVKGDINHMEFPDNYFDLVWCCDGLWPGPAEMGCVAEEPYAILDDMLRIIRPGGQIAILFWTMQKLLPGYPLVEAALNATAYSNRPFTPDSNPGLHTMNTLSWLRRTGFKKLEARTFAADIQGFQGPQDIAKAQMLLSMIWQGAEGQVQAGTWKQYQEISDPSSEKYILNNKDYLGVVTYTMFTGTKLKK